MTNWPDEHKNRVFELIRSLNVGGDGSALDLGCGNGIYTKIIKEALPGWRVYGSDISEVALVNARGFYPELEFLLPGELKRSGVKFDFVFTHHVLEHVPDIGSVLDNLRDISSARAIWLHIMPCGNAGSLEHRICGMRRSGIVQSRGNCFFFEDDSHLRRLSSGELDKLVLDRGFVREAGHFANHFWGALEWMTLISPGDILRMADPRKAKGLYASYQSSVLAAVLVLVKFSRFPANTIDYKFAMMRSRAMKIVWAMTLLFYPGSKLVNECLRLLTRLEWRYFREFPNGSEMYMRYERKNA